MVQVQVLIITFWITDIFYLPACKTGLNAHAIARYTYIRITHYMNMPAHIHEFIYENCTHTHA